jgi:hypothetical protein
VAALGEGVTTRAPLGAATLDGAFAALLEPLAELVAEKVVALLAEQAPPTESGSGIADRAGMAAHLGISLAALDRLRRLPDFPQFKVGDAPRFIVADVLEFLRARRTT